MTPQKTGKPSVRPVRRMTTGMQIVWLVAIFVAIAFALYESLTESGLAGYLMQLQLATIGTAETKLTLLLTAFILLIPGLALAAGVGAVLGKIDPSLVWIQPQAAGAQPGLMEALNRPVAIQRVSWKSVLVVTAIPLVIGAVLYPALRFVNERDQREKVYSVDLTAGPAAPPNDARFVAVTGRLARGHALVFERTYIDTHAELFAPLTGEGWTPAVPVRYFLRHESDVSGDGPSWPEVFRSPGAARFTGKIGGSLPVFVESEFRSKGLKLAPSYTVIEWRALPGNRVPPSDDATIAGGICLAGAFCALLVMVMVKIMLPAMIRRQRTRTAGRN